MTAFAEDEAKPASEKSDAKPAQEQRNRGGFSPERALQRYKDAGVTGEALTKIEAIIKDTSEKIKALPSNLTEEQRKEKRGELTRAQRESINKLLTPEQLEKMKSQRPEGQGGRRGGGGGEKKD